MKYILNSAVITAPGDYKYRHITVVDALTWFQSCREGRLQDGIESCIGYPETAEALQKIIGVQIPVSRKTIIMQPGDEALVFRLVFPQGYRPDPTKKGNLGEDFIRKNCEIGILRRIE